jgi:preprotein translocase subunit SecD
MAAKNGITSSAIRHLVWLILLTLLFPAIIGLGMLTGVQKATFIPNLALDLSGGTQIILTPIVEEGKTVSTEQLTQAVDVIRQRVDSLG